MKNILLLSLLLLSSLASAEVTDKWKINAGAMFVTNFETEMRLTPNNLPVSVQINTKEQLGMKSETGVLRLDGYYRFTDTHSIDFSYFAVRSDGSKTINKDLEWDGDTISSGATLTSHFNMNVYKINYVYSFYHNDKVELALSAGLHITSIDAGIGASGTITDKNGVTYTTDSYSSAASATAPLPVVGFKGEYTVIDKRLFVTYKADYFVLNYETFKGTLTSTALNVEYRFIEHVGVGIGYNANKISLQTKDGNAELDITNNLSGVQAYFTYVY